MKFIYKFFIKIEIPKPPPRDMITADIGYGILIEVPWDYWYDVSGMYGFWHFRDFKELE